MVSSKSRAVTDPEGVPWVPWNPPFLLITVELMEHYNTILGATGYKTLPTNFSTNQLTSGMLLKSLKVCSATSKFGYNIMRHEKKAC